MTAETDLSEEIERIEVRKRELAVWLKTTGESSKSLTQVNLWPSNKPLAC